MEADRINLTVTFLGCGKLGSAILDGLLSSLSLPLKNFVTPAQSAPGGPSFSESQITVLPKGFIACVHHDHSAALLKDKYSSKSAKVKVLTDANVKGVEEADIVILGVEPSVYGQVLSEPGMRDALSGSILVSMVAGVSMGMLEKAIYGQISPTDKRKDPQNRCHIMRVIPNTAAAVRESFTIILEEKDHPYPPSLIHPVHSLFLRVGTVKLWPDSLVSVGATLSASNPAFFALALEGAVDGAVELGMDRADALEITAASMRGVAGLVASGESPNDIKRKIATRGGATAVGLESLEKVGVQQSMQEAIVKTASRVGGIGQQLAKDR